MFLLCCVLLITAVALSLDSGQGIQTDRKPLRVLFIGNSQVKCVCDIPHMIEEISRTCADTNVPLIVTEQVVVGGVGVEGLWQHGAAQQRIAAGGWDFVVFNDIVYSYNVTSKALFTEYAAKFDALIREVNAKTVIFATGDVEHQHAQHTRMYQDALDFARANGSRVAGCGMAWLKAWAQYPELDFHHTDRAHPNPLGYYFNALVLYATLTDSNPAKQHVSTCGAADSEQAALLQQIAWEQYLEDREKEK